MCKEDIDLIVGEDATLESLYFLNANGIEFVIEDGTITRVLA